MDAPNAPVRGTGMEPQMEVDMPSTCSSFSDLQPDGPPDSAPQVIGLELFA